jgi:hypothetical protein
MAMPLLGRWFVAAESESRMGAHGGPHRLYELDPVRSRITLLGRTGYAMSQIDRVSDRTALWVGVGSGGACDPYEELEGYGMRIPALPRVEGGSWDVRRALVTHGQVDVVVRRLRGGWSTGTVTCTPDPRRLRWLAYRDGRWREREEGLADVALADDGRVARVRARVVGHDPGTGLAEMQWLGADVTSADGRRLSLPRDTTTVLFSPDAPMSLRGSSGRGPTLEQIARLTSAGAGPLRFGADPRALQAGTSSVLRFELDARGCGTVVAGNGGEQATARIVGHLVDGRLDWLEAIARDASPDAEQAPLADQGYGAVRSAPRGPATVAGVRVGDAVDQLLAAHGTPRRTTPVGTHTTRYGFRVGGHGLIADVDGSGSVHRIEWRRAAARGICGGAR